MANTLKKTTAALLSGSVMAAQLPISTLAELSTEASINTENEVEINTLPLKSETLAIVEEVELISTEDEQIALKIDIEEEVSELGIGQNLEESLSEEMVAVEEVVMLEDFESVNDSEEISIETLSVDSTQVVVQIPDANLERVLREALNKPVGELTQADMEGLTSLTANNKSIKDLTGLEYAVNLKTLHLYNNQIKDISALKTMLKLTTLSLQDNQIRDISALSELIQLTTLDLHTNQIKDISVLENLVNLRYLYLNQNQIEDLSGLENLINLRTLYLQDNQIIDVSKLRGLIYLKDLRLQGNQIEDISTLENLMNLVYLSLYGNQISELFDMSKMVSLETLDIGKNQLQTLNGVQDLTSLKTLHAQTNQITEVPNLNKLINLKDLRLDGNQLTDISSLNGLINLETLRLSNNQIRDVSALARMSNLTHLELQNNHIINLSGLDNLLNLNLLYLGNNQIIDVVALSPLINLKELKLNNNKIINLTGLESLINLTHLELQYNQILDVSPLSRLINLKKLYVYNNQLTDILALKDLIYLTDLRLHNNEITDVLVLEGLIDLTILHLYNNQLTDISPLAHLFNLKDLRLYQNQLSDITALSDLTNLTILSLQQNQIADVSPLSKLLNLTTLHLYNNQITNISSLSDLICLEDLRIQNNQINDLSALANATKLTRLEAHANQLEEITGLAHLRNLTYLTLENNQIVDFSPLNQLSNLTTLRTDNQSSKKSVTLYNHELENPYRFRDGSYLKFEKLPNGVEQSADGSILRFTNPQKGKDYLFKTPVGATVEKNNGTVLSTTGTFTAALRVEVLTGDVVFRVLRDEMIGMNEKEITVSFEGSFYPIQTIFLPDGTEVQSEVATFRVDRSGKYEIKAVDVQGNLVTQTIDVRFQLPSFELNQAPTIQATDLTFIQGASINLLDYVVAIDPEDGELEVQILSSNLDVSQPGIYEVTFQATDSKGASVTKTIQVTILMRLTGLNQVPTLEVADLVITKGETFDLLDYATAWDTEDGELAVQLLSTNLDLDIPGVYFAILQATDSQGASVTQTIRIIVTPDFQTLPYTKVITLSKEDLFDLPLFIEQFGKDSGLSNMELIEGFIDPSTPGDYILTLMGKNQQGDSEFHQVKITIEGENEVQHPTDNGVESSPNQTPESNSSSKPKEEVEVIETGLSKGLLLGLGSFASLFGLLLFKRQKK